MSLQKINFDIIDREAQTYKKAKSEFESTSKTLQKTIEVNTKNEVDAVKSAIENLNKKVEAIMNTPQIKEHQKTLESSHKQMSSSIKIATDIYFKIRKIIHEKPELNMVQKRKYEKELYKKIVNKFLTPEEVALFEKLISQGPMIIMGGNPRMMGSSNNCAITNGNPRIIKSQFD